MIGSGNCGTAGQVVSRRRFANGDFTLGNKILLQMITSIITKF